MFDRLDAFRVRFSALQDCIGHKLFRNLLKLEDEQATGMIDILNCIDKRDLIPNQAKWKVVREIKNSFSHDYPEWRQESAPERIEGLNLAFEHISTLIDVLQRLQQYLAKYDIKLADI